MKKSILLLVFTSLLIGAQRKAFYELVTSTTCGPCLSYELMLDMYTTPDSDNYLGDSVAHNVVQVRYHVWWPAPGSDPFWWYNETDNDTRNSYYMNNYAPHGFVGGGDVSSDITIVPTALEEALEEETPITIEFTGGLYDPDAVVNVRISSEEDLTAYATRVFVAAVMDAGYFTGTNAMPVHHNTLIEFLGDNVSEIISLDGTNDVLMQFSFSMDPDWPSSEAQPDIDAVWDPLLSDLKFVAWIQTSNSAGGHPAKYVWQAEEASAHELVDDILVNEIQFPTNSESGGPFDIELEITDANDVYTGDAWLYYRVNSVADSLLLDNSTTSLYTGIIPEISGINDETIMDYWLKIYSSSGSYFHYPPGPTGYLSLIFGPDFNAPEVSGLSELYDWHYLNILDSPHNVSIERISDNRFGVDATLHWLCPINGEQTISMTQSGAENNAGITYYSFEADIPHVEHTAGDTIFYWVRANDQSMGENETLSETKYFITGHRQAIGHWDLLDDALQNYSDISWTPFEYADITMIGGPSGWAPFIFENIPSGSGPATDEMTFDLTIDLSDFDGEDHAAWIRMPTAYNFNDGNIGYMLWSRDGGETWGELGSFSGAEMTGENFVAGLHGNLGDPEVSIKLVVERGADLEAVQRLFDDILFITDESLLNTELDLPQLPSTVSTIRNYPNPFNPMTEFSYTVGISGLTQISIYDITGKELETIVNEIKTPGSYTIKWNGSRYASGVYFYRLITPNSTINGKMLMLK